MSKPRQSIKKQRHYFADKGLSSQSYGFSSSHVRMWELDNKKRLSAEELMPSNYGAGEASESPLDCKEIKPVNPKGKRPLLFTGRTDAEALILWPPDVKSQLIGKDPDAGKDWRQEEKEMIDNEMVGWHHWLNGREFEKAPGDR